MPTFTAEHKKQVPLTTSREKILYTHGSEGESNYPAETPTESTTLALRERFAYVALNTKLPGRKRLQRRRWGVHTTT